MPLGIEQNSIAPALIAENGRALVNSIRMIGQQISSNLTQVQTRRDLGNMAQDMQGLNVQSEDFPIQLVQLASRHPLAVNDDRGQMAISVLGKAHSDWRRSIDSANAFARQMKMQTMRENAYANRAAAAEKARSKRPVSVFGVGLVDPLTSEVLVPEGSRGGASNSPRTLSPGSILVDPQGNKIAENPKLPATITPYQERQLQDKQSALKRQARKDQIEAIQREINELDKNISSGERAYENAFKREQSARENKQDGEALKFQNEKTIIGSDVDALKKQKRERLEAIRKISGQVDDLPQVPDNALIPADQIQAPAVTDEWVAVVDPNGRAGKVRANQLEAALQNGYKRR